MVSSYVQVKRANRRSLAASQPVTLRSSNQTVADPTGGDAMPAYKTRVTKGNRHEAKGGHENVQPGAWHLMIDNHPMHFGSAIVRPANSAMDDYIARYDAENEDANGLLPHQYSGLTVVPDMVDIVLPPLEEAA